MVHTHDCPGIRKSRSSEPKKWIDVEWQPAEGKLFETRIRVTAKNARGVLAAMAAAIADANSNIENINMEEKTPGLYTTLQFTIQVANRGHLARILRSLRLIPEVVRIGRVRGE